MARKASELHPELQRIEDIREARRHPESHAITPAAARAQFESVTADLGDRIETPGVEEITDFDISGPHGPLPIRAYLPPDATDAPVVVFFHGGGFVLGSLDSHANICRALTDRTGAVVLSVDYGLAPENPFPGPVEEASVATAWAQRHAGDLGGDPDRLAVAGSSAGGNLAAVVALRARDHRTGDVPGTVADPPAIDRQVLIYPWLDPAGRADRDSYALRDTDAGTEWLYNQYATSDVDARNAYLSPLLATDLSALPPATVVTAGFDPIRDEGFAYADRLADAGVDVTHRNYEAMDHGFLSLLGIVDRAEDALDAVAEDLTGTV